MTGLKQVISICGRLECLESPFACSSAMGAKAGNYQWQLSGISLCMLGTVVTTDSFRTHCDRYDF